MSIPVNIDAEHAIEITTLPYSNSQRVDDGGVTYEVWYKYVATFTGVIGVFGFGDLSVYKPYVNVYSPDEFTWYLIYSGENVPVQFPVTNGQTYYLKFSASGNTSPDNLTVTAQVAPNLGYDIGDILVPDDTSGHPGAIISGTDGSILRYINDFPAGENGYVLPDGTIGVYDSFDGHFKIYDPNFNLLYDLTVPPTTGTPYGYVVTGYGANKFYVAYDGHSSDGTHPGYFTVDKNGNVSEETKLDNTSYGVKGLAVSPDETILYISGNTGSSGAIRKWDLVNKTWLSDLVGVLTGYTPYDIICLGDGSVLVGYSKSSPYLAQIKRYSAAGATLNTYGTYPSSVTSPRIAPALNDDSFWSWIHTTSAGYATFRQIQVSDGTVLNSFDVPEFENGFYMGTPSEDPPLFGTSQSCPFIILRAESENLGTVTIRKFTVGAPAGDTTQFLFNTVGFGESFYLGDDESRVISNITPAGGYGILEVVPSGWQAVYAGNFANYGTFDNFYVYGGYSLELDIYNYYLGPYSGIYWIHPNKINDTIYTEITVGNPPITTTQVVAIPNPYIVL